MAKKKKDESYPAVVGPSDDKWRAECDANDLMRAQEIQNDPERAKAALAFLKKKKKAVITSIDELKDYRNKKFTETEEDEA